MLQSIFVRDWGDKVMKGLIQLHGAPLRAPWQKSLASWWKRLSWPYALPEPLPCTRLYWLALSLVFGAVALFCAFFIYYLTSRHMAYNTNAEDLGIMDQALWNTLHGQPL